MPLISRWGVNIELFYFFFYRGDAFLESYIDGLARTQGPVVGGAEDEDKDGNLIRAEPKRFHDGEEFPDGRDFKFNNLSQVSRFSREKTNRIPGGVQYVTYTLSR